MCRMLFLLAAVPFKCDSSQAAGFCDKGREILC
jgi:hypothetical protein